MAPMLLSLVLPFAFLQSEPASPAADHRLGIARYNQRDYTGGAAAFSKAIAGEAVDSPAWRESVQFLGRCLYLSGRPQEAIPWLEKSRVASGHSVDVLYMLGNAYLQAGNPGLARGAFAELFGVPSGSAGSHLLNAQMMVRLELEDQADKELNRALQLDPRIPQAHFLKGELAIYRGQIDEAIEELRKEIAINPNFSSTYYRLGDALTRREQWDQAIPYLQRSIWLNPTFSGPYILLGKAYLKKDDPANAEGMLRKALRMDPNNSSAHYLLGQVLQRTGRMEEGKQELRRSREK